MGKKGRYGNKSCHFVLCYFPDLTEVCGISILKPFLCIVFIDVVYYFITVGVERGVCQQQTNQKLPRLCKQMLRGG